MFSTIEKKQKEVLQLASRKKIYETVKEFAGAHFREIERKSKIPAASVRYHLHYLKKYGLIQEQSTENMLRYFPIEVTGANTHLLGLLRQENTRKILLFLFSNKESNHEKIVEYIHLSPSTVSWYLKKLEKEQIIKSERKGRKTFYTLLVKKEELGRLLITYRASFLDAVVDRIVEMWDIE